MEGGAVGEEMMLMSLDSELGSEEVVVLEVVLRPLRLMLITLLSGEASPVVVKG